MLPKGCIGNQVWPPRRGLPFFAEIEPPLGVIIYFRKTRPLLVPLCGLPVPCKATILVLGEGLFQ